MPQTKLSRRHMAAILPAFAASAAEREKLPSKIFKYEDLPVKGAGPNHSRPILDGLTRSGYAIECHETELAPGLMPHAAHRHVHEEMVFIREGTLEVTILDKVSTLGPGSVVYVASNEEHGWKNVGSTRARYVVLTLGR
jgi:quercetin dioxygenase-like cupin family protein